jgi:carbon monoxide dehydrogenase subunit G
MQIQRTVETQAAPAAVFDYLTDFTRTTEWDPGTVSTVRVEGDGGVGTVYDYVSEFNGNRTELRYTVVDHVPHSLFRLRGENKTVTAVDTMEIVAVGSGSRVTYTADFTFKGVAKLAVPFLGRAFRKLGDEAEDGLRQALASL